MTSQWLVQKEAPKHFPKPNLYQKKRPWSLFGGVLLVWSNTAFWILAKPLHLTSIFIKLMRCIENCNTAANICQQKSLILLHYSARLHVTLPAFQKLNRLGHKVPPHPPCSSEWVSESHSVVSNSLGPHGLYSPWNASGLSTGVGSLFLLQRIFPTQESNWVSCIVGGFFTSWATGKRHIHLTSRLTDPASQKLSAGKMLPQPAGCRRCFPRVHQILKHGFLSYRNKHTYFSLAKMCLL